MEVLWLIDTENFDKIETKFYGWTVSENNELLLNQFPSVLDGTGSYTYIKNYGNIIEVGQDFLGSQSIYLYKGDGFSCASNSFMRLVKYICNKGVKLTLNKPYMIQYMYSNEEPMSFDGTLVNEIKMVPNRFSIFIQRDGQVKNKKEEYHVNEYDMDSEYGMSIIDKWYKKWVEVYRNIAETDYNVLLDLSGGFDSRICFGIFNNANISRNRVIINSIDPKYSKYEKTVEDWYIAHMILDGYKFDHINEIFYETKITDKTIKTDFEDIIFGNTRICNYKTNHFERPVIHLTGDHGARVHGSHPFSPSEWSDHAAERVIEFFTGQENYDTFLRENAKCIVNCSKVYGIKNEASDLGDYMNLVSKRFYGKKMTLKTIHNEIYITPFMDPLIHSIKNKIEGSTNNFELSALILIRYSMELINYPFQEGRIVTDDSKKELFKISCHFPLEKKYYDFIGCDKNIPKNTFIIHNYKKTIDDYLDEIEENKELVINEFGEEFYNLYKAEELDDSKINSQNFFTPMIALITLLKEIKKSG